MSKVDVEGERAWGNDRGVGGRTGGPDKGEGCR